MEYGKKTLIYNTPIEHINENLNNNNFFIKRDDLIGFSFGGNKVRKAEKFKEEIIKKKCDIIVTYGSSESNHCRVIANMSAMLNIKCIIISPSENYKSTNNSQLAEMFGAKIIKVPVDDVSKTIDAVLKKISKKNNPYFIPGGGHGLLGTDAYVECYKEIKEYEKENFIKFDYVFFASGTGTTQAGLVCGQYLSKDYDKKIVGISIARKKEKGEKVIIESIKEYLNVEEKEFINLVYFIDEYIGNGYAKVNRNIIRIIKKVLLKNGIALNSTYTGKAYYGMTKYIIKNKIKNKNILFINTGGLPLFFDDMEELKNEYINN